MFQERRSQAALIACVIAVGTTTLVVLHRPDLSHCTCGKCGSNILYGSPNRDNRTLKLILGGHSTIRLSPNMTFDKIEPLFYWYMMHLHYDCEDYIRLGHSYDGGWGICVLPPYTIKPPCLVYSFGINYDFSFDDAVSIKYGCTVRSYDPSMSTATHRRGPNIWFYKTGIGPVDNVAPNGWKIRTLKSLIHENNDTGKTIDYLKFDIEGHEWTTLEDMLSSGVLMNVKQLGFEIHVHRAVAHLYSYWKVLDKLEAAGFRRWYWALNFRGGNVVMERFGARSCCYEMVYINTKLLTRQ